MRPSKVKKEEGYNIDYHIINSALVDTGNELGKKRQLRREVVSGRRNALGITFQLFDLLLVKRIVN
ncbi:MAG TPA: hypothetical protein VL651_17010, partial [Bacteroidia bacterium]|nr:hypothetical protein [Bacteroidia bacterium]